jgi:hypothetical protein
MLKVAVSGSFHRHMQAITAAVHELAALSVRVLSPADPRVVAHQGEFLFVASDRVTSVRLVQDRHLESIRAANFLWLVCPDGYVGQSASMEIGFAAAMGVPIFAVQQPADLTLRQYVEIVPDLKTAVRMNSASAQKRHSEGILIDPHASVEEAHYTLDRIQSALTHSKNVDASSVRRIYRDVADLQKTLALPVYVH